VSEPPDIPQPDPSDDRLSEETVSPGKDRRIEDAEEAVRRAQEELRRARQLYRRVRRQATDRLKRLRQATAGELVDGALRLVRQYPGPSILIAVAVGFFLGRSLRR